MAPSPRRPLSNQEGIIPGTYKVSVEPLKKHPAATKVPAKYHSEDSTDLKVTVNSSDKEIAVKLP